MKAKRLESQWQVRDGTTEIEAPLSHPKEPP